MYEGGHRGGSSLNATLSTASALYEGEQGATMWYYFSINFLRWLEFHNLEISTLPKSKLPWNKVYVKSLSFK
jgi:hypothetical protein